MLFVGVIGAIGLGFVTTRAPRGALSREPKINLRHRRLIGKGRTA